MTTTVTGISDLLDDIADLDGFRHLPGIAQLLDGYRRLNAAIANGDLTADDTQTLLCVLAGDNPSINGLNARTVANAGDAGINPALADIPEARRDRARDLTAQYRAFQDDWAPTELPTEAAAAIDGI